MANPFEPQEATAQRERKIKAAMAWLKIELMAGPRVAGELEAIARARGIPHTTLQHARKRAGIHTKRQGNRYFWSLPAPRREAAHTN